MEHGGKFGRLNIIIGEQPLAVAANEKAGELMAAHISQTLQQKRRYTLMDWGPGTLGTTEKILKNLSPDDVAAMRFILVDVMPAALANSSEKLQQEYMVKSEDIIVPDRTIWAKQFREPTPIHPDEHPTHQAHPHG